MDDKVCFKCGAGLRVIPSGLFKKRACFKCYHLITWKWNETEGWFGPTVVNIKKYSLTESTSQIIMSENT